MSSVNAEARDLSSGSGDRSISIALGRANPSRASVADRWLSTTGAVLAAVTVLSTAVSALGVWWADPVAALVIAACALALAITLVRQ